MLHNILHGTVLWNYHVKLEAKADMSAACPEGEEGGERGGWAAGQSGSDVESEREREGGSGRERWRGKREREEEGEREREIRKEGERAREGEGGREGDGEITGR